jgi:hypothetical protein
MNRPFNPLAAAALVSAVVGSASAAAQDDHLMLSLTACVSQSAQQTIHQAHAFDMSQVRSALAKDCQGVIAAVSARDGADKTDAAITYIGKGIVMMHDKGNPQFNP